MQLDPLWLRTGAPAHATNVSFSAVVCANATGDGSPLTTACSELSTSLAALLGTPVPLLHGDVDRNGTLRVSAADEFALFNARSAAESEGFAIQPAACGRDAVRDAARHHEYGAILQEFVRARHQFQICSSNG